MSYVKGLYMNVQSFKAQLNYCSESVCKEASSVIKAFVIETSNYGQ